ncbi:MAG: DUF4179 domain-containing protein [Clostridiales bacterium]|nr:DUF4179 domain-containing protein [Clostridiales bacterium]
MPKDAIRDLFDSVTPDASIVLKTEREIRNMIERKNEKRRIPLKAAAIALAACLILTGTALALNASGILERLFPNGNISKQAKDSVVTNAARATENGITLNLDEYLIDQNTMHLGWTVSSERERDVFYTTAYELIYTNPADEVLAENSIGGRYGSTSSIDVGNDMMVHLSKASPVYSGFTDYGYNGSLTSPIQAKVIVQAYETDYEIAEIVQVMDLYEPGSEIVKNLEKEKKVAIDALHRSTIGGYSAFLEARDKRLKEGMDIDEASEIALVESGVFRKVAVLEVNVTIQPGQTPVSRYSLSEPMVFDLPGKTVVLKTLTIDSASTIIEYDVITGADANSILKDGLHYILFDQNGNPLTADYYIGMEGGEKEPLSDGRRVWNILHSGNPIPEDVTQITFVPKGTLERMEMESSNNYFIRIKAATEPESCFTVFIGEE